MSAEIIVSPDGKSRCRWCGAAPEFLAYHDTEWGFPVSDDHRLFEKLSSKCLVPHALKADASFATSASLIANCIRERHHGHSRNPGFAIRISLLNFDEDVTQCKRPDVRISRPIFDDTR